MAALKKKMHAQRVNMNAYLFIVNPEKLWKLFARHLQQLNIHFCFRERQLVWNR